MSTQSKLLSVLMQMGLPNSGADVQEAVPFALIGPPGIAKTAGVTEIANAIAVNLGQRFPVETLALPQAMPEHIGGCPVPNWDDKVMELFVLRVGAALKRANQGVLFLDEATSCPVTVGAAAQTALQNGKLGDFILPPSVARGVAMNDPSTATAGRPLSSAESNRFCWIQWELSVDAWSDYMLPDPNNASHGVASDVVILPDNWEARYYPQTAFLVTQYCKANRSDFMREPPPHDSTRPWPSPRSWRNLSRILAAGMSTGERLTGEVCSAAISGCVGDDVAQKFLDYVRNLDIPDPEEVLKDPENFKLPKRDDKLVAAINSVVTAACDPSYTGQDFLDRWRAGVTVCERFEKKKDVLLTASSLILNYWPAGEPKPKMALWYNNLSQTFNSNRRAAK